MPIGDVEEDQQHSGMTPSAETRRIPASWTELAGEVPPVNSVELHRQPYYHVMYAKFSNVELHRLSKLTRPVFSLEIAVELRHGELSSCANTHTEHL